MRAEILTIGDEILIGQIVDTNSAFLASELTKIGVSVFQISSVQDDREHIIQALKEAESRAELIIMTGGLGPTKDDITKHTLCEYVGDELKQDDSVLEHIEELFRKYISTPISDLNRRQALVPSRATVLHNAYGTAPGMWMKANNAVLVSLPGVPLEMKALFSNEVIPRIRETFRPPVLLHRTLITYGLGESAIAQRISDWQDNLPRHFKLAYLPNLGKVRLRLSAKGTDAVELEEEMDQLLGELADQVRDILYGEEAGESLEETILRICGEKNLTLGAAESFTGGRIASQITMVPGASKVFLGSMVTYATRIKNEVLGVSQNIIEEHSVVSEAVARAMAKQARKVLGADFAIATTGNAGPTKGDSDSPVGTVYLAVSGPNGEVCQKFEMGNHRERIVQKAVHKGFEMLMTEILKF